MYIHICIHTYTYYTHAHKHTCSTYVCMQACMHACKHACMHACIHTYIHIYLYGLEISEFTSPIANQFPAKCESLPPEDSQCV